LVYGTFTVIADDHDSKPTSGKILEKKVLSVTRNGNQSTWNITVAEEFDGVDMQGNYKYSEVLYVGWNPYDKVEDEEEKASVIKLQVSTGKLTMLPESGTETVTLTHYGNDKYVKVKSNEGWCEASITGKTITVATQENTRMGDRQAIVDVLYEDGSISEKTSFRVYQYATAFPKPYIGEWVFDENKTVYIAEPGKDSPLTKEEYVRSRLTVGESTYQIEREVVDSEGKSTSTQSGTYKITNYSDTGNRGIYTADTWCKGEVEYTYTDAKGNKLTGITSLRVVGGGETGDNPQLTFIGGSWKKEYWKK
jgi:hypothetical protein